MSQTHLEMVKRHNAWQAYHNYQHCFVVALSSLTAAEAERLSPGLHRILFLSALYHDLDHRAGGGKVDSEQVQHSASLAVELIESVEKTLRPSDLEVIRELILTSEFPRRKPPLGLAAKILRDADLLATDQVDHVYWLKALQAEQGVEATDLRTIAFLNSQSFYTTWGINRKLAYIDRLLERISHAEVPRTA